MMSINVKLARILFFLVPAILCIVMLLQCTAGLEAYHKKALQSVPCQLPRRWLDVPSQVLLPIVQPRQEVKQKPQVRPPLKRIKKPTTKKINTHEREHCEKELAACAADKGCHARGCEELKYYYAGRYARTF